MRRKLAILALAALSLAPVPPALAGARVYVRMGPPAAIREIRAFAPSPRHVWIAGYHRWDGHRYAWVRGRWDLPTGHSRGWVSGHWAHDRRHGWYWVEGHWK